MLNVAPIFTIVVQISKLRIQVNLDTLIWLEVKLVCWNTWFSITYVHNLKIYIFIYLYLPFVIYILFIKNYIFLRNNWIEILNIFFTFFCIRFRKYYYTLISLISKIINDTNPESIKLNLSYAINFKFETH